MKHIVYYCILTNSAGFVNPSFSVMISFCPFFSNFDFFICKKSLLLRRILAETMRLLLAHRLTV